MSNADVLQVFAARTQSNRAPDPLRDSSSTSLSILSFLRIKAALARDPGQTMKNIGAFSIAAAAGRESGNFRYARTGEREAAGA